MIEEGLLTEPVFFIGHYIHYTTMSFLFNSELYFPHNYHKEEKEEYVRFEKDQLQQFLSFSFKGLC